MRSPQELYDEACQYYDDSQRLVYAAGEAMRKMEIDVKGISTFSTKVMMAEFDEILQGILLTQALADNKFDEIERRFINLITNKGDLLGFIRYATRGKLSLTWDEIAEMDSETQSNLIAILPDILKSRCQDFLSPLLIVQQYVDEIDFMAILTRNIIAIGSCLAGVDQQVDDIEAEGMSAMLTELLIAPWFSMKEAIEKMIKENQD